MTEPLRPTLGRYTLIRRIARGGMGELFLAELTGAEGWHKQVCIKTILPHLSEQDEFVQRFVDEARIATSLSHGNIVPVFDMGRDEGGTLFIVMEYVDGWDLRTLLRRVHAAGERIPLAIALYVAAEVCRGLDYAHTLTDEHGAPRRIVHRDISPSNIVVSRGGEVKIVDFGIAAANQRLGRTVTGELRGKFAYMSPEQASGQPVDARADLYSLGVVLYELLAGTRPFEGDNDLDTLRRAQQGLLTPLAERCPELEPSVTELVDRALRRDPADRFPDAASMQAAVLNVLYQDTTPAGARQLAAFCATWDRERWSTGLVDAPGTPGFETLLRQQLDGDLLDGDLLDAPARRAAPREATPSAIRAGVAARDRRTDATATITAPAPDPGSNAAPDVNAPVLHPATVSSGDATSSGGATSDGGATTNAGDATNAGPASDTATHPTITPPAPTTGQPTSTAAPALTGQPTSTAAPAIAGSHAANITAGVAADAAPWYRSRRNVAIVILVAIVLALTMVTWQPREPDPTQSSQDGTAATPAMPAGQEGDDPRLLATATTTASDGTTGALDAPDGRERGREATTDEATIDRAGTAGESAASGTEAPGTDAPGTDAPGTDEREGGALREDQPPDDAGAAAASQAANRQTVVDVTGLPADATLVVDGRSLGTRRTVRVPADGRRLRLTATAPGFASASATVTATGDSQRVTMSLEPVTPGQLTVRFIGGVLRGEIRIDGRSYGENERSSRATFSLPPGVHEVEIRNAVLGLQHRETVELEAGQQRTVTIDWQQPEP